jgi:hypothetical protein
MNYINNINNDNKFYNSNHFSDEYEDNNKQKHNFIYDFPLIYSEGS